MELQKKLGESKSSILKSSLSLGSKKVEMTFSFSLTITNYNRLKKRHQTHFRDSCLTQSVRMIFTLCLPCDFIFHLCDFFESITSSQPFEWNAIDVTFHLNHISIVKKRQEPDSSLPPSVNFFVVFLSAQKEEPELLFTTSTSMTCICVCT